jgi:uncharacterized protein YndB with AHSA1/START domain
MSSQTGLKTMEITLTRTIQATPDEVFDGWLDPENPGTPWSGTKKLILPQPPKVDQLFYFLHLMDPDLKLPHFGRFTVIERPAKIQYTWMSWHTQGMESIVTVTFRAKGDETLLTLNHANLPDTELGRMHQKGWEHYAGIFEERFAKAKA